MSSSAIKNEKAPKVTVDDGSEWEVYDDRPALTETEIASLLTAPELGPAPTAFQRKLYYRDLVLMGLLYDTKARIGELCKATIGDLRRMSTAEPELYIRFPKGKVAWRRLASEDEAEEGWHISWRTIRGNRELWGGPTVHEPRYAGISPRTKQHLDLFLDLREDGRSRAAPLLIGKHGALTPRGAQLILKKYAQKVGLTIKYVAEREVDGSKALRLAVTPHAFREAGERHQLDRGANAKAVAEETGHSVATQQKFYNRVNRESVRNAQRLTNPFYHGVPGGGPQLREPSVETPSQPIIEPNPKGVLPASQVPVSEAIGGVLLAHPEAPVKQLGALQEFASALGVPLKRITTLETLMPLSPGDAVIAADPGVLGASMATRIGWLTRLKQEGARLFLLEECGEVDLDSSEQKRRVATWGNGSAGP
ncbi:MAG TPA: hypothetical protein VNZ52_01770 [Candidatus Thermoplasmatota archaeon]|nr:hypothetical protein [Candidatus Thermoplasmatota archaeon]